MSAAVSGHFRFLYLSVVSSFVSSFSIGVVFVCFVVLCLACS